MVDGRVWVAEDLNLVALVVVYVFREELILGVQIQNGFSVNMRLLVAGHGALGHVEGVVHFRI